MKLNFLVSIFFFAGIAATGYALYLLGPWPLIGFIILLLLFPIQGCIGKYMMALREKAMPITDKRVRHKNAPKIFTSWQESPPVWTQEAYCPPHSKCSLCCSVSWWGWGVPPSNPEWGIPPIQSWMGVPLPLSARWRYPESGRMGVSHIKKDGVPIHQEGLGYAPPPPVEVWTSFGCGR